jgi:2-phosphoglycolate phosphatase
MDAPTLFFDLDGTLIDSRKDIANSVNLTRADYGLEPLPLDAITAMVGNGVRQLMLRAMPDHAAEIETLLEKNRHYYYAFPVVHTTMYPGVPEALAELKAMGCKMAVTSNKTSVMIPRILERLDILKYFDVTVGGGDVPVLKPDPGLLYLAAERMGVTVRPTDWVIGDHYTDLEVGRHAGVRVCHCAYGFGNPREERFDLRVNNLRDFSAALRDGKIARC